MYHTLFNKEVLIIGCGNPLLGDDGFGPAVIKQLEANYLLSGGIGLLDAGTSVRDLLFDLILVESQVKTIIIIDAINLDGKNAGDIFKIDLDHIPENKIADYSIHQFPSSNMLKEIKEFCNIQVLFYSVQIHEIPDFINPGLSQVVEKSVIKMCDLITRSHDIFEVDNGRKEYTPC